MSRGFAGRRAGYPSAGWVQARGVLTGTSQRRGSAPTPQVGLFQQPAKGTVGRGLVSPFYRRQE
jgi:hypothetical protein